MEWQICFCMKTAHVSSITQLFHNTTMQSLIMRMPRLPLGTRYQAVFRISVQTSLINPRPRPPPPPASSSSSSKIYLTNSLKFKDLRDIFVQRREMQIETRKKKERINGRKVSFNDNLVDHACLFREGLLDVR